MSTPHCSFVIYLDQDSAVLQSFLKDLRTFFQKFPINYEVMAVVEKKAVACLALLQKEQMQSSEKEHITILHNQKTLRRAESLKQGLTQAQGIYLIVADPLLTTPLADLLKIMQHLMSEENADLCWGNRLEKKGAAFLNPQTSRHRLEHFFTNILKDKNQSLPIDPLSEIGGIKKTAWMTLEKDLPTRLRGWYFNLGIQSTVNKKSLRTAQVPIQDSGQSSLSYSLWRERWHLLNHVIKS